MSEIYIVFYWTTLNESEKGFVLTSLDGRIRSFNYPDLAQDEADKLLSSSKEIDLVRVVKVEGHKQKSIHSTDWVDLTK